MHYRSQEGNRTWLQFCIYLVFTCTVCCLFGSPGWVPSTILVPHVPILFQEQTLCNSNCWKTRFCNIWVQHSCLILFALLMERCRYLLDSEVLSNSFNAVAPPWKHKKNIWSPNTHPTFDLCTRNKQLGYNSLPWFTFLKLFYRSSMGSMILIYYTLAINQRG